MAESRDDTEETIVELVEKVLEKETHIEIREEKVEKKKKKRIVEAKLMTTCPTKHLN